jgi:hypothetical protein
MNEYNEYNVAVKHLAPTRITLAYIEKLVREGYALEPLLRKYGYIR